MDSPQDNPEFVYAGVRYHMTLDGLAMRELPWHHDYPYSDEVFPSVLAEVTNVEPQCRFESQHMTRKIRRSFE
jgi:hypothetical protein